jgi:hypothetical protein
MRVDARAASRRAVGAEQTVGISRFQPRAVGATLRRVTIYLVERYLPEPDIGEIAAAIAASGANAGVRHMRATFVPADETSFHVIEAPSVEVIQELLAHSGISYERIVEAVDSGDETAV